MYPVYKLLRAVNRQYPNNGFINYVDVREDTFDSETDQMIPEDLRDLINETLQEIYIDIALDEVYSFPTVPGQNQYMLPEDCDLRDVQEVTRTYTYGPIPPPRGPKPGPVPHKVYITFSNVDFETGEEGTGVMEPLELEFGSSFIMPSCTFIPPEDKAFAYWQNNIGMTVYPGQTVEVLSDETYSPHWIDSGVKLTVRNCSDDEYKIVVRSSLKDSGTYTDVELAYDETTSFSIPANTAMSSKYDYIDCYFNGNKFIEFNMNEMFEENTMRNVAHPVVHPDPEHPGDNDDGGYSDNPLVEPTIEEQPINYDPDAEWEDSDQSAQPHVMPE